MKKMLAVIIFAIAAVAWGANDVVLTANPQGIIWSLSGTDYVATFAPAAKIYFVSPTPADNATITNNSATIKINIDDDISAFAWQWIGTNYTLFNSNLIWACNFDNVDALGESATNVLDISQYANVTTPQNGAQYTEAGKYNGGYTFTATNSCVSCPTNSAFTLSSGFTISSWVKINSFPAVMYVASQWGVTGAGSAAWGLYLGTNGLIWLATHNGSASAATLAGLTALQTNTWYYIAGVYTGGTTGNNGVIYINGIADKTGTLNQVPQKSSYLPTIGNAPSAVKLPRYFNGTLDEVRLYNRGLNADEILQLYRSNLAKYAPARWLFQAEETGLANGTYTFGASEVTGSVTNQTETRTLNVDVP